MNFYLNRSSQPTIVKVASRISKGRNKASTSKGGIVKAIQLPQP